MTDTKAPEGRMVEREVTGQDATRWIAFAEDAVVAHGRAGAVLAFRKVDGEAQDVLLSTITFNSMKAAAFALETMAGKELERRLSLARRAAGGL